LVFELSKVEHPHVRSAVVGHLRHIDPALAQRVAGGLGLAALPDAPETATPVTDLPLSPALQIIGKMLDTLDGRAIGILVEDGSDAALVAGLTDAASAAGATVKVVAPRVGGVTLSNGRHLAAHGQLAGTPSVVFDAVAVVLSVASAARLTKEAAALDFVRDAYGHLKAIAVDAGGQALLEAAGIEPDDGVLDAMEVDEFVTHAATRHWSREATVRTLA